MVCDTKINGSQSNSNAYRVPIWNDNVYSKSYVLNQMLQLNMCVTHKQHNQIKKNRVNIMPPHIYT